MIAVRVILIVLMAYYTTSLVVQTIDNFKPNALPISVQNVLITDATTRFRSSTGPAVLGSERESIITILPGSSNKVNSASITSGQWSNAFLQGTTGWSILQYDGTDGASALSLSPGITNDGSALDLTYGNTAFAFYMTVTADLSCYYQINYYGASKTEVSSYGFIYNPAATSDPIDKILIPFTSFVGTASINSIHAIEILINNTQTFVINPVDTAVQIFGVFAYEVQGTVYTDCDQDGLNNGENPIVGATVTLKDSNNVVLSTQQSNVNGTFDFRGLTGGSYTVCVSNTITNTNPTFPSTGCLSVTLQNANDATGLLFGYTGNGPTSIFPPANQIVQCGSCTSTACLGGATYAACGSSAPTITSQDVTTGSCPTIITRTFSATGVSSVTQTITVVDTTAPTIEIRPTSVTVPCSNPNPTLTNWVNSGAGFTASDCSSITYTNNWDQQQITNNCGGSTSVVFTAIDSCGNMASSTATYTLTDNVTPVFTKFPTNNSTACDTRLNSDVTAFNNWLNKRGYATATDDCTAVADLVWSNNNVGSISQTCNSVKTVTFTVTDKCGNSNSAIATFTVTDIARPSFNSPAKSLTVLCSTDFNTSFKNWLSAHGGSTATDNCTPASSLVYTNNYSGAALTGCGKQIIVTFYATDSCGNRSAGTSATFTYKK